MNKMKNKSCEKQKKKQQKTHCRNSSNIKSKSCIEAKSIPLTHKYMEKCIFRDTKITRNTSNLIGIEIVYNSYLIHTKSIFHAIVITHFITGV